MGDYIITSGWCGHISNPPPWKESMENSEITKCIEWHRLWRMNLYIHARPSRVIIFGSPVPEQVGPFDLGPIAQIVWMVRNFGHQISSTHERGELNLCGWSRAWVLGLWWAYMNECDHIWVEQDVLCFGDWVGAIYRHAEENNLAFMVGAKKWGAKQYQQENSLTFTQRDAIPAVIEGYLFPTLEKDCVEIRIAAVRQHLGGASGFLPFGYGFKRPERWTEELPFYIHRAHGWHLKELANSGLIDRIWVE